MPHFPKPFFKKSRRQWYVEIDRRQISLGSDREAAFRRYHELMREPQHHQPVSSTAFSAIADAFLDWVKQHRAPDTFEWYRYRMERFCLRYPDLTSGQIRPYHVQQWVDSYPDLTRTSKRNYVRTLKRCCKWATQQGYIDADPLQHLEVPGADRRETLVTAEQYAELLALVRDDDFRDLVVTTWESGCRPQESLRVEARHVDVARRRWVFPKSEAKGKRQPRIIYLSEAAWEITQRRMQLHPTGPIFRNTNCRPWTPDAVNCQFDRLRVRLLQSRGLPEAETLHQEINKLIPRLKKNRTVKGVVVEKSLQDLFSEARRKVLEQQANLHIPRFSLYALRHAWATRALQSGLDGLTVAILMGHSDPSTLARVYQHLSHNPEHLLQQAQKAASQ
ncbi:MAG: tyrosine-type recombinase/integrase [Planctomycetaceae bacterium]|nr:tyrosine-type recombinase/integrase [Planctomycetaceae bacterium]